MEMVERVARAIAEKQDGSAELWRLYEVSVRAGIEVMRVPTEAMREAGESALSENGVDYVEPDDSAVCFTAMIDAALKTA